MGNLIRENITRIIANQQISFLLVAVHILVMNVSKMNYMWFESKSYVNSWRCVSY